MIFNLNKVRQAHLYLGMIFAPSIIFLAFSGSMMVFSLHEKHDSYAPPRWIEVVAQIHKNQNATVKHKAPELSNEATAEKPRPIKKEPPLPRTILKYFFLIMAAGIILTTILGIYMSFFYNKNRQLLSGLLILGLIIPAALLLLQ